MAIGNTWSKREQLGCLALTESVADFELLVAGPGGVIAAGRPAGRVPDGVLGRRRGRRCAAHEEQRGQGQ